ncbi:ABC transporter ATP-binding protein, partial [bacterium]|nr:ABC transporter ATP-binding protein [bacterium]
GPDFALDAIADQPYIRHVLDRLELTDKFIDAGRRAAATMVEMFSGLEPGHAYFERFSFINFSELPEYQAILARFDKDGLAGLKAAERNRLLAIPFRLVP